MGGFVSGVAKGGIVALIGLAVLSEVLPPPAPRSAENRAQPAAQPAAQSAAPEAAPAEAAPAESPVPATPAEPATPAAPADQPPAKMPEGTDPPANTPAQPVAPPEPAPPEQPAPEAPPAAEATPTTDAPLPNELPATSPLAVNPAPAATPSAEPTAPTEPLLDRPEPAPAAAPAADGVTTGRLPVIAPAAAPAPPTAAEAPPRERFAAPFENPQSKPLFAVILIDDGRADLDRETLARLPLPVTIALDPARAESPAQAALYRANGKEVALLATGLPKGAKPTDIATALAAAASALPEAVAVVDLPTAGFQNDLALASDVVPLIGDQGRGLVTFDAGLNAADQVARREGVPSAVIFRQLDAEDEGRGIIRRYLDRAAFKAAQDGRVTVLGTASPETLAALVEWSVEGRAGSVALAPLTAVLQTGN